MLLETSSISFSFVPEDLFLRGSEKCLRPVLRTAFGDLCRLASQVVYALLNRAILFLGSSAFRAVLRSFELFAPRLLCLLSCLTL